MLGFLLGLFLSWPPEGKTQRRQCPGKCRVFRKTLEPRACVLFCSELRRPEAASRCSLVHGIKSPKPETRGRWSEASLGLRPPADAGLARAVAHTVILPLDVSCAQEAGCLCRFPRGLRGAGRGHGLSQEPIPGPQPSWALPQRLRAVAPHSLWDRTHPASPGDLQGPRSGSHVPLQASKGQRGSWLQVAD